jgi:hypothetical protein
VEIMLHHGEGTRRARSDSLGRFTFHDVPSGSIRLTCKLHDESGAIVQTEWTLI